MPIDLNEYHQEQLQHLHNLADANGIYVEDAFFQTCCDALVDAGEIETHDRAYYVGLRGVRVDGYGGDPLDADGLLSLIAMDLNQMQEISTLTATEMDAAFRRLYNFADRALDERFRNGLEETDPAFGLADLIATRWPNISRVRLILISNRALSDRVDRREAETLLDKPVTYTVWDLNRFHRYETSGQEREDLEVRLEDHGNSLPVLPAHEGSDGEESYLAVVPGRQLASIYDRWGTRLLEQNVRVFLQARGKVNRGIRNTITNMPEMFFAYNNGITATAEALETHNTDRGMLLTGMRNFQIVNGGQTTASLHEAFRNKLDTLDRVFVQMKLTIVPPERAMEVVPKISEYANTQNSVSSADFFSNHPFHVRMEGFSRRLFAPSPDGNFRQSKWFYERARGQYQDARGHLSRSERLKFDLEYPKHQVLTKTDLAKFLNVWREKPDTVSKGAQKNFADFAAYISASWERQDTAFGEMFFREAIAKAFIFKAVEKLVPAQPWYHGGYRANIVAYTIAKLAHDLSKKGASIDFERIWRSQNVSDGLASALTVGATAVHKVIVNPPSTTRNVTEWAKQQACWHRVAGLDVPWPSSLDHECMSQSERRDAKSSAIKNQKMLTGIEVQSRVVEAGAAHWHDIRDWAKQRGLLTPTETGILNVACLVPSDAPSDQQCIRLMELTQRLIGEGLPTEKDVFKQIL